MSLDSFLRIGETIRLGSHTFTAEEIKQFAAKHDPQPFHIDEEAAGRSIFGALCASGWHTCAMWMRYNLMDMDRARKVAWDGPGPRPEFGPSPGFSNLKWPKPVYAGDTITFIRTLTGRRPLGSRPGWQLLLLNAGAFNGDNETVLAFDNSVLLKTG
ncbi:MaoC family dehydratase [Chelativorans sp. AA-79]|uniref:MaoC family dehydratase n=1 Tax=Chelativorans sp. AA-79 TaxID=3028735 RepID=UPI0023F935CF|nr:MaoC family dehydratase [Chelativorans sp. AA-79]WEX07904.1 MaoC family dehydratase [Chelativorans sp. AA-79]